jgi:predicted nucleic acid-binding protein
VIVVDASCVVEVLLRTSRAGTIEWRWGRAATLHAPEIIDLEILQVLRTTQRTWRWPNGSGTRFSRAMVGSPDRQATARIEHV